jgi:hypothetical protein
MWRHSLASSLSPVSSQAWAFWAAWAIAQEVELSLRDLTDSCLLLVDRELQLAHDLAQLLQRLIGFAPPAQDHEIVGVGHDARAEALLQSELLSSQYEPAHVYIRQQR